MDPEPGHRIEIPENNSSYLQEDMLFYVRTWTPHLYEHRIDGPFVDSKLLIIQILHSLRDGCEPARSRVMKFFDGGGCVSGIDTTIRGHPNQVRKIRVTKEHNPQMAEVCRTTGSAWYVAVETVLQPDRIDKLVPPAMIIPVGHYVAEKMKPWTTHPSERQAVNAAWSLAKGIAEGQNMGYVLEGDQYAARPFRLTVARSDPRGAPITTAFVSVRYDDGSRGQLLWDNAD
ncbi:hypothetical protein LTR17_021520 [Elasticomyces elasticus]|nr:hypothetical protein LTR17_021520 [Elasticomyces elasticus]